MIQGQYKKETLSGALAEALSVLPRATKDEVISLLRTRRGSLSEIRLRAYRPSFVVIGAENIPLYYKASPEEINKTFLTICKGSLYAYRDTITEGFVSLDMGVRVGVVGEARYEGGNLVGVGEIESLIFRIPSGKCSFAGEIFGWWLKKGKPNLLICSPPASGKTTLLRALAEQMGSGRNALRTVVIDSRREFIKSDYINKSVDILRGYSRDLGIEVALRTMSAQVILVDEISGQRDAAACLKAYGAGVSVICTAHADRVSDLYVRDGLSCLMHSGMFSHFVKMERTKDKFGYTLQEEQCAPSAV